MKHRQEEGLQYGKGSARSFYNGEIDDRHFFNDKNIVQYFYRDVHEGDLIFRANLSDYLDTGLFLDARKKRALIRAGAAGKRVLNLFAYTCSLSVCAAKGGASQVDSIDLSNTYLEWGRINFALNRLQTADNLNFINDDVIKFINHARKSGLRWDIIILDPPSFSNSKKMRGTIDLRRDHQELIRKSLSLLNPGGTLWFSSNAKGVKIDDGDFPDIDVKDMGKELVDEDFRGKRMPVCYALAKPF
jgi:23S rRNA G2069 N7-methylase RlmK/C1962 C5-methylase RlmI